MPYRYRALVDLVDNKVRAHSKFSASAAERWFNCPGSVELSEGQPDKSSVWAKEGTLAHEFLEKILLSFIGTEPRYKEFNGPPEMISYGKEAAKFIFGLWCKLPDASIRVETRIYLDWIHPEMFGTFDGAVIDYFGTLHVFDYKYGAGHSVSPIENLQMLFYAIGLAHKYKWNFSKVRMWIIQPRIRGYDGPVFWEISIGELRSRVKDFVNAVRRVKLSPNQYVEGAWCWWCKAKSICPLKVEQKRSEVIGIFKAKPVDKDSSIDDNFY